MNPKIAHRGEQNGSFLKSLNSYPKFYKYFWDSEFEIDLQKRRVYVPRRILESGLTRGRSNAEKTNL